MTDPPPASREHAGLALLAALLVPLWVTLAPVGDFDVWFHLATGRLIAATHAIPRIDVFSFTARGRPWIVHEWLWELAAWELWRTFGPLGLILFRVGASWVALTGAWFAARAESVPSRWAGLATAVMSLAAANRFTDRPQMATLACFGVALGLLALHRHGVVRPWRWACLPLFLLWANAHAGVVYGLGLIAYEAGWALLKREVHRGFELALGLGGALLLCVLATPFGVETLAYPFRVIQLTDSFQNLEYRPLWTFLGQVDMWPPMLSLAVGSAASVVELRRNPRDSLRTLVLVAAALWHVRGIDVAGLSAVPVLGAWLGRGTHLNEARRWLVGTAACLALVMGWLTVKPSRRPGRLVDLSLLPTGAVAFLDQHEVPGDGYNTYTFGGYLIFADPSRPVFLDGRLDPYEDLLTRVRSGAEPFGTWPLRYALTSYDDPELPTIRRHLRLAWFDDLSQVALADHPDLELTCLLPEGPFFAEGAEPSTCLREALRMLQESPHSWRSLALASAAVLRTGDSSAARRLLERAASVRGAPGLADLINLRGLALALAASPEERASDLRTLSKQTGDLGAAALAALAEGDCASWKAFAHQFPTLWMTTISSRSPVSAMEARACAAER